MGPGQALPWIHDDSDFGAGRGARDAQAGQSSGLELVFAFGFALLALLPPKQASPAGAPIIEPRFAERQGNPPAFLLCRRLAFLVGNYPAF